MYSMYSSIETQEFNMVLEIIATILAVAILVWVAIAFILLHLLGIVYGKWMFHRKIPSFNGKSLPGVSIVKPLVGIDPNMEQNLLSFFNLEYPMFELLFCFESCEDPALPLVQKLISNYPNIKSKVFIGGENVGINPKVNNLMPGYRAAKYELVIMSDARMKMKKDALSDMVIAMADEIGVVIQMPFTCDRPGFAAAVEKVYFGTTCARGHLGANLFGIVCTQGMSFMMRKRAVDDIGGMEAFGSYFAEDMAIGRGLDAKGWKWAIASQPSQQNSGNCSIKLFNGRLCRWAKLRIGQVPLTYWTLVEPLLQDCFLLGLMASWAAHFLFQLSLGQTTSFFFAHVLVWLLLDYCMLCTVQNHSIPCNLFYFVTSWLYLQIVLTPIFLYALCNQKVKWGDAVFQLERAGLATITKKKSTKYTW